MLYERCNPRLTITSWWRRWMVDRTLMNLDPDFWMDKHHRYRSSWLDLQQEPCMTISGDFLLKRMPSCCFESLGEPTALDGWHGRSWQNSCLIAVHWMNGFDISIRLDIVIVSILFPQEGVISTVRAWSRFVLFHFPVMATLWTD